MNSESEAREVPCNERATNLPTCKAGLPKTGPFVVTLHTFFWVCMRFSFHTSLLTICRFTILLLNYGKLHDFFIFF